MHVHMHAHTHYEHRLRCAHSYTHTHTHKRTLTPISPQEKNKHLKALTGGQQHWPVVWWQQTCTCPGRHMRFPWTLGVLQACERQHASPVLERWCSIKHSQHNSMLHNERPPWWKTTYISERPHWWRTMLMKDQSFWKHPDETPWWKTT